MTRQDQIAKLARAVLVDNTRTFRRESVDPKDGEVLEWIVAEAIHYARRIGRTVHPWGHYPDTVDAAVRQQHLKTAPAEARPQ